MNLTSKAELLAMIARHNPVIWEILHPHVPNISEATRQVMAAMVIKTVARGVEDRKISASLQEIGKTLFTNGTNAMSYDDDDWCGTPWPHHFPIPVPDPDPWLWILRSDIAALNPQPLPPQQNYLGALLVTVADAVSDHGIAENLRGIGTSLLKMDKRPAEKPKASAIG